MERVKIGVQGFLAIEWRAAIVGRGLFSVEDLRHDAGSFVGTIALPNKRLYRRKEGLEDLVAEVR